jgi:hypothetical protein
MKTVLWMPLLFCVTGCNYLQPTDPAIQTKRNAVTEKGLQHQGGGFEGTKPLRLDYERWVAGYKNAGGQ